MIDNRRIVLDTNVLISALLNVHGVPGQCVKRCRDEGFSPLFCDATFDELHTRLAKPKFDKYRTAKQLDAYLRALHAIADWHQPLAVPSVCRDPDDDKFLALASDGGAQCLVTGDDDLLTLVCFRAGDIVKPADWLHKAHAENP